MEDWNILADFVALLEVIIVARGLDVLGGFEFVVMVDDAGVAVVVWSGTEVLTGLSERTCG